MIERVWLDAQGEPVLSLFRHSPDEALLPLEESLPELMPVGQVQEVAGTGVKIYVGSEHLTSGSYTLTLGTYGRTHADNFNMQRTVIQAAARTRAVQRNGATLPIASFAKITRIIKGGAQVSGRVAVEFVPASAYWLTDSRRANLAVGQNIVNVGGAAQVPLCVIFPGPVTNPTITTDAGKTTWLGSVPTGSELVIDARPGVWSVSMHGHPNAALQLNGPQPYLETGNRVVGVTAPATLEWMEAEL